MRKIAVSRPFTALLVASLVAALAGCASTERRYKKGQALEGQGRLEEASLRYIAVLTKEPGRADARERLADVGARLVEDFLAGARADEADGRYEDAVAEVKRLDDLRARTSQVGVVLSVPDDYEGFRANVIEAAAASLYRQGSELERAGNWAEASRRYDLLRSYPLRPEELARVDESRARVLLRWAEQDMSRALFRAAYGHAQTALDILGPDSEAGADARAVQKAALDAGTVTFAVLPFRAGAGVGADAPRGMETDLYDSLLYERLDDPPLFVGPIDRGAVHRQMDRLRVRSADITDRTAASIGLALGADLVVVGRLDSYGREESAAEEIPRKAVLRRDRSTSVAYTEKRFTVRLTGEAVVRILDPGTRRAVDEETVSAHVSAPFRRASFDGDHAALDLSREERELFDRESWRRAEEELQARLVDELAGKIAPVLFDRVLRRVR